MMKLLVLVAALCVAARAFPFPNGTISRQVTDVFSQLFPNTTFDGIQKAFQERPADLFKCVGADQQEAFTACRTEAFSRHRQRGSGSRGHGGRGKGCNATTTESPVEEITTQATNASRSVRSPRFPAPRLCVPKCYLQKLGMVDTEGRVVQANVTAFIDGVRLTADQKTATKTAFQSCVSANLTLPDITQIAGPHRFNGPFANRTRPFPMPMPDSSCMKSTHIFTCLSGSLIRNGCSTSAAAAAIKLSSSEESSEEDYHEAESSEESYTSAKLKREDHSELNEAAHLKDEGSADHANGTSSEETGTHHEPKRGQRNNRGRKDKSSGQRGGSKKADGGSSNSTEPQQDGQQQDKAAPSRLGRGGGNQQRGSGQKNKGTAGQSAALQAESLTEDESLDGSASDGGDSSGESLEFDKQIPEPIQDDYSQLPGANVGRNPGAGRPGVAFKRGN